MYFPGASSELRFGRHFDSVALQFEGGGAVKWHRVDRSGAASDWPRFTLTPKITLGSAGVVAGEGGVRMIPRCALVLADSGGEAAGV